MDSDSYLKHKWNKCFNLNTPKHRDCLNGYKKQDPYICVCVCVCVCVCI